MMTQEDQVLIEEESITHYLIDIDRYDMAYKSSIKDFSEGSHTLSRPHSAFLESSATQ